MPYTYNKTTNKAQKVNPYNRLAYPDWDVSRSWQEFEESNPPITYAGSRDLKDGQELKDWEVREVWQYAPSGIGEPDGWFNCSIIDVEFHRMKGWKIRTALIDAEPEKDVDADTEHLMSMFTVKKIVGLKCRLCGAEGDFDDFPKDTFYTEWGNEVDTHCKNPDCEASNDELEDIFEDDLLYPSGEELNTSVKEGETNPYPELSDDWQKWNDAKRSWDNYNIEVSPPVNKDEEVVTLISRTLSPLNHATWRDTHFSYLSDQECEEVANTIINRLKQQGFTITKS